MSLRAKLATTIAALCMVICLLTVGVFAINADTTNITGTVKLKADHINATVTAQVTGSKGEGEGYATAKTLLDVIASDDADTHRTAEEGYVNEDWTGVNFEFADRNSTVVLTIIVTNRNQDTARTIKPTATMTLGGVDLLGEDFATDYAEVGTTNVQAKVVFSTDAIDGKSNATYTVSLQVVDKDAAVNDTTLSVALTLTDGNYKAN